MFGVALPLLPFWLCVCGATALFPGAAFLGSSRLHVGLEPANHTWSSRLHVGLEPANLTWSSRLHVGLEPANHTLPLSKSEQVGQTNVNDSGWSQETDSATAAPHRVPAVHRALIFDKTTLSALGSLVLIAVIVLSGRWAGRCETAIQANPVTNPKGRQAWPDNARFIMVTLVIFKHMLIKMQDRCFPVVGEHVLQTWLHNENGYWHAFFNPLFTMMSGLTLLSGYLSRGEPTTKKWESLFTYVFLPYVFFTIVLHPLLVFVYGSLHMFEPSVVRASIRLPGTYITTNTDAWYLESLIAWRLLSFLVWHISTQTQTPMWPWFVGLYATGGAGVMLSDHKLWTCSTTQRTVYFMPAYIVGYLIPIDKVMLASRSCIGHVRAVVGVVALVAWFASIASWTAALPYKNPRRGLDPDMYVLERSLHICQSLLPVLMGAVLWLLIICTIVPQMDLGYISFAGKNSLYPYLLHTMLILPAWYALLAAVPGPRVEHTLGHLAFHLFLLMISVLINLALASQPVQIVFSSFLSPAWCSSLVKAALIRLAMAVPGRLA